MAKLYIVLGLAVACLAATAAGAQVTVYDDVEYQWPVAVLRQRRA